MGDNRLSSISKYEEELLEAVARGKKFFMGMPQRVTALLSEHPGVSRVVLTGSRDRNEATLLSDWDFQVVTSDFGALRSDLPELVKPLRPLGQQWDRLSRRWNYMLMLEGPVKVDLLIDRPHRKHGPWEASPEALPDIDLHFWDWILWLGGKALQGRTQLVNDELDKMMVHLLRPLGAEDSPTTTGEAVEIYLKARECWISEAPVRIDRRMEQEVRRALAAAGFQV